MTTLNIGSGCGSGILQLNLVNNSNDRDFIQKDTPALFEGSVSEIRYSTNFTIPTPAIVKFKVWRQNGTNLDFVGQTEQFNIVGDFGCTVLAVQSTITGVQVGDYLGVWVKKFTSFQVDSTSVISQGNVKTGDNTGSIAESSTTTLGNFAFPVGFFSEIVIPPSIPDLPVRAKDPVTGESISFFTDYAYVTGGVVTKKSYRSLTGNLHTQKYNNYDRYEIPIIKINSEDLNNIRRWKRERVPLFFTENHSETTVDSGFSVKVKELNITEFKLPYSQSLWDGEVVLETI